MTSGTIKLIMADTVIKIRTYRDRSHRRQIMIGWAKHYGDITIQITPETTRTRRRYQEPVFQFDRYGRPLQAFGSLKEAAIVTGTQTPAISMVATGRRLTAGGFKWSYEQGGK